MKKRLAYKKYKQALRKAMEDEIDGVYLTKKMAKEKISQIFEEYVKYISKESLLELVNSGS